MTRTLVVRAAAGAEIEAAAGWYERRQPDLGGDFVVEVEATFARVLNAPFQFAVLKAGDPFRRALVERFPYHVFFEVLEDLVVVVAVAHERRRPGYWRRRDPG